MERRWAMLLLVGLTVTTAGCASNAQHKPVVPTAASVTRAQPGGDAREPHEAALERLLRGPIADHRDRFGTLRVPLADRKNWRRVRFYGHPTRANFRYGDDHHAVMVVEYWQPKGDNRPETCLKQATRRATPIAERFSFAVQSSDHRRDGRSLGDSTRPTKIRTHPRLVADGLPTMLLSGQFETLFNDDRYHAAAVAYPSWPGTCLVSGFAVRAERDDSLAKRVVERWVTQVAPRLRWRRRLTKAPPVKNR